jgi:hypothetical protein
MTPAFRFCPTIGGFIPAKAVAAIPGERPVADSTDQSAGWMR